MRFARVAIPIFLAGIGLGNPCSRADEPLEFFEKHIRPVLVRRCYKCHSQRSGKQQGALLVDSRDGMLRGGESGRAVVPRNAEASLLIQALRYESFEMPPDGQLPASVVADFVRWIEMGAPDPRVAPPSTIGHQGGGTAADETNDLWSLQPLRSPEVPSVEDRTWPWGAIDRFILARLDKEGLRPASDAPILLLCRRLYLTLTGLPPTFEQSAAYRRAVHHKGQTRATQQLVDSLLASARFGERWGRQWLDLARYSDTNVGSTQRTWTNAWLYRNYVIKRFNEDTPFDRFVLEQIAGDMLPAKSDEQRADQLVATGFLALATRDLTERDAFQIQLDGIDDALDTIGKSMLGLNIGCARCHDHKFDPIPTEDYYALAGILKSSWLTGVKARQATFNGDQLIKHSPSTPRSKLPGGNLRATTVTEYPASDARKQVSDMAIHLAGSYRRLGEVVPRGFIKAVGVEDVEPIPEHESGRVQLAHWLTSRQNPLTPRVMANRVWYWLVGRPLVEPVDNFGTTGRQPSHPELLDWLAIRLRDHHGWQLKPLIREIVLSRTWQMSTSSHEVGMAVDPDNSLCWRMNLRRLEAEQVHDSLLSLGGDLDLRVAAQTTPEFEQDNTTNTSHVKIAANTLRKRAVYFPVFRKDMPIDLDVLQLFNFPDPKYARGRRESTTLPAQALFLWNSPLAHRAAERIARRLMDPQLTDKQRARQLILLLFARAADTETVTELIRMKNEFQDAYEKLGREAPPTDAWKRVIHTMLMSNEFMFVG